MKQHVLVTGGAGYIGSILVPELLKSGHEVTVLDKFMFEQNSLAHVCADSKLNIVRGDVREKATVAPLIKKADIIIPLAALVGAPLCNRDPETATAVNKEAIFQMMDLSAKSQPVLIPTTNSGYGVGEKNNFCTEETPLRPISLYGRDKVAAEAAVLDRGNAISFRLATVFGMSPRMRLDLLVNDFVYRAVNDKTITLFEGHFRRNFVHIRDVAAVFLFGIGSFERMKNEVYNVGLSEANLSKQALCERIKKHIPEFDIQESADGKDPDKRDYIVSNEKIEKIGFKTTHSLDDGIRELMKGYAMIKKTKNNKYANV
jgi:nucleoside-diphosphate-sugar epimerase